MRARRLRSVPTAGSADDETTLLVRAGRGDEHAFSALYDAISPLVHGVVLKVLRDPAMSAEVTQEVFVDLWRVAPRFDAERGSVRGWVSTIAHRKAVDRVRSEQARRDREHADALAETPARDQTTDLVAEQVARGFDRERVRLALADLTPGQHEAITLAYFGGHTYREVATLLDIAEGTAKTRIRDGLIKLRDRIGAER